MAKKNKFIVCFVLDETGSMQAYKTQTIDGYNEYIEGLRDQKNTEFMLVTFNSAKTTIGSLEPIKDVAKLNTETYKPDMLTPLYDTIGSTIQFLDNQMDTKEKKIIFTIMTDGMENASKDYSRPYVFDLIKEKEKKGWQFVYLGANQDAYSVAGSLGVPMAATANFAQTKTAETFRAVKVSTQNYMADPSKSYSFTEEELNSMEE